MCYTMRRGQMRYLAILGRQPEISLAELSALFSRVSKVGKGLATFVASEEPAMARLGGSLKIAVELKSTPLEYLQKLPEGKITLGVSDYSKRGSARTATMEALKLKKILVRHGRSVRVVANNGMASLSTATALHNGLSGKKLNKVELILLNGEWWRVIGVQDIDAYGRRDQARPARDAKVGMLPPKLAQILINLCGKLPKGARVLDPFCGTGVVLQEAALMGYQAYGTDISERMVDYAHKNLEWLGLDGEVAVGDATDYKWQGEIDAVAFEGYLGRPMSTAPVEIKLKTEKQECGRIIVGFLKNLAGQIEKDTPVVMAIPAWLRSDGSYSRLNIVDVAGDLGYNVENKQREGLLYFREGQVVAREIIILRKK